MQNGSVIAIYTAPERSAPIVARDEVKAVAGKGLEGDRYFNDEGWDEPKKEITLVEIEAVEAASREYELELKPEDMRRQIVTKGVALNHLVDKDFHIGDVHLRGVKIANPCSHLQRLAGKKLLKPMMHRGGLRAQILSSGTIKVGDPITTS